MQQTVPTAAPPQSQVLLGRYRVLETNTQGGFGTVSVCWDSRLQRRVAIKRMPLLVDDSSPATASTLAEALKEARTSSLLTHPNIVRMYDFEADDYYSYLVMEYVDGLNLAELLARVEGGVLTYDECAHLIDSVSSALSYAHENGVLHLDIKPANILIDRNGTVKLGDFGMATLASAAGYGGARGGTVGYMPPEQIEGNYVDERTDLFSLAVVVWQALTGHCPYAAQTPEQSLALIQRGPSPALSRIEPELAGIVEETLLRALDPSPSVRTSSVEEFARDIVRPLGDTQDGADSLADLLNQTEEAQEPQALQDWDRLRVPLLVRHPWLGGLCCRTLAAATAGWVAWQTIPILIPASRNALHFGVVGMAAASAAWPPLNGVLSIFALAGAILSQPSRFSFIVALMIAVIGMLWWITVGRGEDVAGTALLVPSCLSSPLTGAGLAGFSLTPVAALLTGTGSYLFYLAFEQARAVSFMSDELVHGLYTQITDPTTWAVAVACGLSSWLCSLLTGRGTLASSVVGQLLVPIVLCAAYAAGAYMENANIRANLDIPALAVAVSLALTLCVAAVLCGDAATGRKDERI